jgi:hypothetical protein
MLLFIDSIARWRTQLCFDVPGFLGDHRRIINTRHCARPAPLEVQRGGCCGAVLQRAAQARAVADGIDEAGGGFGIGGFRGKNGLDVCSEGVDDERSMRVGLSKR